MFTPRIFIQNMQMKLGNTTQSRKRMQILTHFKDKMEQTELHSAQLVILKVSTYPVLLNERT